MKHTKSPQSLAIVLAGGKGTRMKSKDTNKTALLFRDKPILTYGLELFDQLADQTLVVTGAYADSLDKVLADFQKKSGKKVLSTLQKKRLGTGHAAQVADRALVELGIKPKMVWVGYGDHLMFYQPQTIEKMAEICEEKQAAIVMVVPHMPNPTGLGRVIFDENRRVQKIVEEKNATEEEKKITTINAGLYCFDYDFFHQFLPKLKKNSVSGEYYLTDLVELAVQAGKTVLAHRLPYAEVGIGINTLDEKLASEQMHAKVHQD